LRQRSTASTIFFSSVAVGLSSYLFAQKSPFTYYGYSVFPVYFWEDVYSRREAFVSGFSLLFAKYSSKTDKFLLAINAVFFVALLQSLVSSLTVIQR
jgi:GPI ethanolamine phosphate transferase 1